MRRADQNSRKQVACAMVQSLARQSFRDEGLSSVFGPSLAFRFVNAHGELHERIKPFTTSPGSVFAVSAQRGVHYVGIQLEQAIDRIAKICESTWSVGLQKNVRF